MAVAKHNEKRKIKEEIDPTTETLFHPKVLFRVCNSKQGVLILVTLEDDIYKRYEMNKISDKH